MNPRERRYQAIDPVAVLDMPRLNKLAERDLTADELRAAIAQTERCVDDLVDAYEAYAAVATDATTQLRHLIILVAHQAPLAGLDALNARIA